MTADDRTFAPPHELVGPLGQVVDAGGGFVPGLAPVPVPGALGTASPGLATAAVSPAPLPHLGPDDPATLALAIARLAGELFGIQPPTSLSPLPLAPASALTPSNVQFPASPGISPVLVPPSPTTLGAPPAANPDAPTPAALTGPPAQSTVPTGLAAPTSMSPFSTPPTFDGPAFGGVGVAAPAFGAPAFGAPAFGAPAFGAPAFGAPAFGAPASGSSASGSSASGHPASGYPMGGSSASGYPASGHPASGYPAGGSSASGYPAGGYPASGYPASGYPASGYPAGGSSASGYPASGYPASGYPASGYPPSGSSASGHPASGYPVGASLMSRTPAVAAPSGGADTTLSPFAVPLGALPIHDAVRMSLVESGVPDPAAMFGGLPYFLPAAEAVGLEGEPGQARAPRVDAYEVEARPAVIRDLGGAAFDPYAVRRDFPILEERVHGGKRLVWLDNAATTQKPRAVIDRLSYFYEHENSNIHRAAHALAARATDAYEGGRESVRRFLRAPSASDIIFVRGATEGINLIAQSWGRRNVAAGDEILITHLEHHANIVPWQQLCAAVGARLRVAPVDDRGDVILEAYERLLGPRTRVVAFPQVSNAIGTVTPAREMIEIAHRHGAVVVLDGAQAVSHMAVDVQALDCDFYVFSGHKVFAPTGIGAVFGKRALLEAMPPWQGGGNMIQDVTFERTTYQQPPWRFEAGTGNIADAVGLGTALDYVMRIGMDAIDRYEHELLEYAERRLATVPGLHMIGAPRAKAGVLSFVLDGQRTEDVGAALDQEGIAVRSGHHCAQPILRRFGVEASVRASLAFYNVCEDIDALTDALHRLQAGRGNAG